MGDKQKHLACLLTVKAVPDPLVIIIILLILIIANVVIIAIIFPIIIITTTFVTALIHARLCWRNPALMRFPSSLHWKWKMQVNADCQTGLECVKYPGKELGQCLDYNECVVRQNINQMNIKKLGVILKHIA